MNDNTIVLPTQFVRADGINPDPPSGAVGASVFVQDNAPPNAVVGTLWYDTDAGI